jgi:osmotically-inducible protein OsmY
MKTDNDIEKDLKAELSWESRIKGANIITQVNDRRVTLSGTIDSYLKKIDAEKAAMKIEGVIAVDNLIKVQIPVSLMKKDAEIEKSARDVLKWNSGIDESKIRVEVKDGWVSLEGKVDWEYQRSRARKLVEGLTGVVGVTSLIEVNSTFATSREVKDKIDAALRRNYYLNTNNIHVEVNGSKALLTGKVHTLAEKKDAETASWSAPGITEVINELVVTYSEVLV